MNAPEDLRKRRRWRGKYRPDPVPREESREIEQTGLAASSGCIMQAADDPEVMKKLHGVIDPPVGETAPAMICVLSQRIIAYRDRRFAVQDYAAAIENMLLAITVPGDQSCWYEEHITDEDRIGAQMARLRPGKSRLKSGHGSTPFCGMAGIERTKLFRSLF